MRCALWTAAKATSIASSTASVAKTVSSSRSDDWPSLGSSGQAGGAAGDEVLIAISLEGSCAPPSRAPDQRPALQAADARYGSRSEAPVPIMIAEGKRRNGNACFDYLVFMLHFTTRPPFFFYLRRSLLFSLHHLGGEDPARRRG